LQTISNNVRNFNEIASWVNHETLKATAICIEENRINLKKFEALNIFLQKNILREFIENQGNLRDINSIHLENILKLAIGENGKKINLPNNLIIAKHNDFLYIEENKKISSIVKEIKINEQTEVLGRCFILSNNRCECKTQINLKYDIINTFRMFIRTIMANDKIYFDEIKGNKSVVKFLKEKKIIESKRKETLVLANQNNEIIAVILDKIIINSNYKPQKNEKKVLFKEL
jgi:hypothetical protein